MTRSHEGNGIGDAIHLLATHGFDAMAVGIEILFNEAMKKERQEVFQARPVLTDGTADRPTRQT